MRFKIKKVGDILTILYILQSSVKVLNRTMIADEFSTTKEDWDLVDEFGSSSKRNAQSSPIGNMSAGDLSTKRSFSHQRSSMSDFTDAVSASADDNTSEYDLIWLDHEIVMIAGVNEPPELQSQDIVQVPLPSYNGRCFEPLIPKPHPKAVVLLESPNTFLIVSREFCNLFGFSVESEICGRAVDVLQGPRTDLSMLVSGITGSALAPTTRSRIILYDRAGRDIELDISFSLFLPVSGDNMLIGDEPLAGCVMELSLVPGGS